jgi:hypothetical protein
VRYCVTLHAATRPRDSTRAPVRNGQLQNGIHRLWKFHKTQKIIQLTMTSASPCMHGSCRVPLARDRVHGQKHSDERRCTTIQSCRLDCTSRLQAQLFSLVAACSASTTTTISHPLKQPTGLQTHDADGLPMLLFPPKCSTQQRRGDRFNLCTCGLFQPSMDNGVPHILFCT